MAPKRRNTGQSATTGNTTVCINIVINAAQIRRSGVLYYLYKRDITAVPNNYIKRPNKVASLIATFIVAVLVIRL